MTNHNEFFDTEVPKLIELLKTDSKPKWGIMNATDMVDHVLAGTNLFMSKHVTPLELPEEYLPRAKAFLMSDKPFKPSAKKPGDYQNYEHNNGSDLEELKSKFLDALKSFNRETATDENFWSFHPSFGKLNAEETRQLQFKHLRHHFQQFGLM